MYGLLFVRQFFYLDIFRRNNMIFSVLHSVTKSSAQGEILINFDDTSDWKSLGFYQNTRSP